MLKCLVCWEQEARLTLFQRQSASRHFRKRHKAWLEQQQPNYWAGTVRASEFEKAAHEEMRGHSGTIATYYQPAVVAVREYHRRKELVERDPSQPLLDDKPWKEAMLKLLQKDAFTLFAALQDRSYTPEVRRRLWMMVKARKHPHWLTKWLVETFSAFERWSQATAIEVVHHVRGRGRALSQSPPTKQAAELYYVQIFLPFHTKQHSRSPSQLLAAAQGPGLVETISSEEESAQSIRIDKKRPAAEAPSAPSPPAQRRRVEEPDDEELAAKTQMAIDRSYYDLG